MKKFKVNELLSLRLEQDKNGKVDIFIYVDGIRFRHCKYLLLTITPNDAENVRDIDSIDEVIEKLDKSYEKRFLATHKNIARLLTP